MNAGEAQESLIKLWLDKAGEAMADFRRVWLAPKPASGFTYFEFFTRRQACGLTGLVVTTNVFDFLFELFASETETLVETARPYPLC